MDGEKIRKASEIFNTLLQKKQVTEKDDQILFNYYVYDDDIQIALDNILEGLGFYLYNYRNGLYLSVKKDNKVFGFSNEELKSLLGLKLNNQLYLCYFIMYTVILSFYHESSTNTQVDYIKNYSLMEKVTEKLKAYAVDKSELEEDKEDGFYYMNKIWNTYDDVSVNATEDDAHDKTGTNTKIALVNRVLKFMTEQGLLRKSIEEKTFEPTLRLRAIIANYYDDKDNKSQLNSLINN